MQLYSVWTVINVTGGITLEAFLCDIIFIFTTLVFTFNFPQKSIVVNCKQSKVVEGLTETGLFLTG